MGSPPPKWAGARARRRPGGQHRTSAGRVALISAKVLLSGYLLSMLVAKGTVESGIGTPASVTFRAKDLPRKMKLKAQNDFPAEECRGLGGVDDPYFVRYNGDWCGEAVYESRVLSSGIARHEDDQVAKVTMLHKSFASDEDASEYFWRFWGLHTSTAVPARLYIDVRDRVARVGNEYRALYYSPELVVPVSKDEQYTAAHLQYLFRQGRSIVMLTFSGFPGIDAKAINPYLAQAVAQGVASRTHHPFHATAQLRAAAIEVLEWGSALDATLDAVVSHEWHIPTMMYDVVVAPLVDAVSLSMSSMHRAVQSVANHREAESRGVGEGDGDGAAAVTTVVPEHTQSHTANTVSFGEGRYHNASCAHTGRVWVDVDVDVESSSQYVNAFPSSIPNDSTPLEHILPSAYHEPHDGLPTAGNKRLSVSMHDMEQIAAPIVFGVDDDAASLDYLGVLDDTDEDDCATIWQQLRGIAWLLALQSEPPRMPCQPHTSTDLLNMVTTVAVPLGLLALIEVINSASHSQHAIPLRTLRSHHVTPVRVARIETIVTH